MADRNGYIGRAPSDSSVVVARQTFSPTGITTDFTFASGSVVGYLDVFLNGAKQIEGQDYDANNGSTFTVSGGGVQSGDILEAVAYKAFNVSNIKDAPGNFTVGNNLTVVGTITGDGSALTGVAGGKFSANDTGISTTSSVGIGTTNATGAADSNNTAVLNVGVVTANFFYGNGGGLTGIAGTENIITGTAATFTNVVKVGTAITLDATSGIITATSFSGSGANLTGVTATDVGTLENLNVTGVGTFGGDVSVRNLTGVAATFTGVLTYEDVASVDSVGIVTARGGFEIGAAGVGGTITAAGNAQFVGFASATAFAGYDSLQAGYFDIVSGPTPDPVIYNVTYASKDATHRYFGQGSGLGYKINGVFSPWLTLTPGRKYRFLMSSDDMSAHPFRFYKEADKTTAYTDNVTSTSTYTEILVTDSTPQVLHYQCSLHGYMGNGASTLSNVAATQTAGLSTAAATVAGIVTTLDLSSAQDHKITVSGISTVTVKGGTEGDSHTVRIINSGITTVGFSTFFLFPSGADPSMPTASGAISLISFTVNRVGAGGTQLLAGAALNYS